MLDKIPAIILVALGGLLGATSRYVVSGLFQQFKPFPFGTLTVNVIGSLVLGVIVTLFRLGVIESFWISFIGIGFLGSFTTMSTFAVETINLSEESLNLAFSNLLIMFIFVFIGAYLGKIAVLLIFKGGKV